MAWWVERPSLNQRGMGLIPRYGQRAHPYESLLERDTEPYPLQGCHKMADLLFDLSGEMLTGTVCVSQRDMKKTVSLRRLIKY